MVISMQTNPTLTHTAPSEKQYRVVMVEQLQYPPPRYGKSHWRTLIQYADDNTRIYLYWGYNDEFLKSEKI